MKLKDALYLDCTKEESKKKIKSALLVIKPVKRETRNGEDFSIETLEKCLHKLIFKYGYRVQWITPYYEEAERKGFIMYTYSLVKREGGSNVWKGSINAKTLWEIVAKAIIQVYVDIKEGEKE